MTFRPEVVRSPWPQANGDRMRQPTLAGPSETNRALSSRIDTLQVENANLRKILDHALRQNEETKQMLARALKQSEELNKLLTRALGRRED